MGAAFFGSWLDSLVRPRVLGGWNCRRAVTVCDGDFLEFELVWIGNGIRREAPECFFVSDVVRLRHEYAEFVCVL